MSLPTQVINVNLRPLNEQAPDSAGPTGRVSRANNAVIRKFTKGGQGPQLRLDKRPGVNPLSSTVRGGPGIATLPGHPQWLAPFRNQLVGLFGVQPYVYSEPDSAWQGQHASRGAAVAPKTMKRRSLFNGNTNAVAGDGAAVGDKLMYVFRTQAGATLTANLVLRDATGAVLSAAATVANSYRIKIVSDGARFWVFSQAAAMTSTVIQVIDATGAQLATSTIAWGAARDRWDVRYQPATGRVVLATPLGATTDMQFMSYSAGAVVVNTHTTPAANCTNGVAFLDNSAGTNVYISGADATNGVRAFEIGSAGALTLTFPVDTANTDYVGNITGFAQFGGLSATFVVVAYSVLQDNTAGGKAARDNLTRVWFCDRTPTATLLKTQRSLSVASRAFRDAVGNYFAVMYYQSTACSGIVSAGYDVTAIDAQPSFFVMRLSDGSSPPAIVGQFDYGFAAFFEGSRNSANFYPWRLPSVAADTAGRQYIPLGYLGEQSISPVGGFLNLSGLNEYVLSPLSGRPVETADELLIGGMGAQRFDGATFSEDGLPLAPEYVSSTPSAGGNMNTAELYNYVPVYEWLDNAGNVVQSVTGKPQIDVSLGAGNKTFTSTWTSLRTSSKANVRLSIYRTYSPTLTNTSGVILRKVGEVPNDPTVDTLTFVDTFSDAAVRLGQSLYRQPLDVSSPTAFDYYPAPAFSRGALADGRTFVVGYDGAIWFSEQRVEGQGQAFNPFLRIVLPTTAEPTTIVPVDARMLILCDDGTAWTFPIAGLPNNTATSGSIPQPEQLPFTVGSTGAALMLPVGAVFGAEQGAWLMDRALSADFIGSPVLDEVSPGLATIVDICVDREQRVYFTLGDATGAGGTSTTILVYDLLSGAWTTWTVPTPPVVACSWKGRYVYADDSTSTVVWLLDKDDSTTFTDNTAPIITTIELSSIALGGPNGFQRMWGGQFFGEYKGPHLVKVSFAYDNSDTDEQIFTQQVGVDPDVYRWEFRQDREKCAAVTVTFEDSFAWPTLTTIVSHTP